MYSAQLVYFHTSSVLQTAGWWQPQGFWGWYRDRLVSSCSAAAVSPCAPDQTGDEELQRLHIVETQLHLLVATIKLQ